MRDRREAMPLHQDDGVVGLVVGLLRPAHLGGERGAHFRIEEGGGGGGFEGGGEGGAELGGADEEVVGGGGGVVGGDVPDGDAGAWAVLTLEGWGGVFFGVDVPRKPDMWVEALRGTSLMQ